MNPYEELLRQAGWLPNQNAPVPTVRPTGGIDYGQPTPEDQAGVLDMAKHAAASGLGMFQSVMDTFGGRAVKGLLAGKPRELLSVLPMSDTIHLTDPTQRTSGRDLLEKWGAVDHAEAGSGLDAGDVAGFGLDLALDPSSYLFGPGAALTKGGQVAKAAGILPKTLRGRLGTTLDAALQGATPEAQAAAQNAATKLGVNLADLSGQQLGGLGGVGLPFSRNPLAVFGQGPRSQALAETLGRGTDWLGQTGPARVAKALFQKKYESQTGKYAQEILGNAADPTEAGRVAAQAKGLEIERAMQAAGGRTEDVMHMLRPEVEGTLALPPQAGTPEGNALRAAAGMARSMGKEQLARELEAGLPISERPNYFHRQLGHLKKPTPGFESGPTGAGGGVSGMSPHLMAREEMFDVPGATDTLNQIGKNTEVSGINRGMRQAGRNDVEQEAALIRQQHLNFGPTEAADFDRLRKMQWDAPGTLPAGHPLLASLSDADKKLLGILDNRPALTLETLSTADKELIRRNTLGLLKPAEQEALVARGLDKISPDDLARFQHYTDLFPQSKHLADWYSKLDPKIAEQGLDIFPNTDPIGALVGREAASHRAVSRLQAAAGVMAKYAQPSATAPADWLPLTDAMRAANMTGPGANEAMTKALGTSALGRTPINDIKIPRELYQQLTSLAGVPNAPQAAKGLLGYWDSATSAFKTGVSTIFPKKYIRDATQDAFRNLGQLGPSSFLEAENAAKTIVKDGKAWAGANTVPGLEHLSAEAASKRLADEVAARSGFYGPRSTRAGEELGAMGERGFREHLPGEEAHSLLDIMTPNASRKTTYDPRDIAGFGGRTETKFAPAVAAAKVQELGSEINKTALYIGKRMEGYAPDAAWAEVVKSHYDYSNLSGFEKSVMKRAVPFYNWTRQNLPSSLEELVNHPGGLEATVAKGASSLRSNNFVPKTAGDVLAIPMGQNEDGSERYLGRTGLQVEDALKNIGFTASPGEAFGDLSPYIKAPIELATGHQLGSGRKLSELQGITGNPIFDELLHQGALSRILSTERTAMDERKGLGAKAFNLLAPASITDINPKTKENALRQVVEEKLAHSPNVSAFERYYVRPDNLQNLSPEELMLLRVYTDAEKKAQAANRAQKPGR